MISSWRSFDTIARAYRWLEYLSFGRALERCRCTRLDELAGAEQVLVLGDGDGRFTAALLAAHRQVHVVAVDSSAAMLALLAARVRSTGQSARLTVVAGDARRIFAEPCLVPSQGFDHVCSHFFLDCLTTAEVRCLLDDLRPRLKPGATWIVSEFAAPTRWARLVVRLLYLGFALLTAMEVQQLPEWQAAFEDAGFCRASETQALGGLLTSSAWRRQGSGSRPSQTTLLGSEATAPLASPSQQA